LPPRNSIAFEFENVRQMSQTEYEAAVTEFVRTVCLAPTQGSVAATDRLALQRRAEQLEELRQEKLRDAGHSALLAA